MDVLWLNALEIAQKQRCRQEGINGSLLCQKEMIPGMQQCSQLVWSRTKGSEGGEGFLGQGAAFQC